MLGKQETNTKVKW